MSARMMARVKRVAEAIKKVDVPDCSGTRPHYNVLARAAMAAILTPDEIKAMELGETLLRNLEHFWKADALEVLLKDLQGEKA